MLWREGFYINLQGRALLSQSFDGSLCLHKVMHIQETSTQLHQKHQKLKSVIKEKCRKSMEEIRIYFYFIQVIQVTDFNQNTFLQ